MDTKSLEALVRQILMEKLGIGHGVKTIKVPELRVAEADRMDTGNRTASIPKICLRFRRAPGWEPVLWR